MSFDARRFVNFRPDPEHPHLDRVDLLIVCNVHEFRARPLVTVVGDLGQRPTIFVHGEPLPESEYATFSPRCGAENDRGRCRVSPTWNRDSLLTLADYLRLSDRIAFTTREIDALINYPEQARRYWIMRAKLHSEAKVK